MSLIKIEGTELLFSPSTMEILADRSVKPRDINKQASKKDKSSFSIQLLVTSACNLNCRYCFGSDKARLSMDTSTVSEVAGFVRGLLADYERVDVNFFGGEPLVNRPAVEQLIAELTDCDRVSYALTTNGTLVDDEMVELLTRCKAAVCVSLDGPEHIHNRFRPHRDGSGSFAGALSAVERCLDAGLNCSVESVVDLDSNLAVEQYQFLRTLGVRRIQMSFNYFYDYPLSDNSIAGIIDQIWKIRSMYLADLQERRQRCYAFALGPCFGSDILLLIHNMIRRPARCREQGCSIAPDGKLYHCAALSGNEQFYLGSVTGSGPQSKSQPQHEICSECWAKCFCGGLCALQDMVYSGGPDPGLCAVLKSSSEAALRTYVDIRDSVWEVLAYFERQSGQKNKQ